MISDEKSPNHVDLAGNKRLQRALEHWQPAYLDWWRDMGPQGFQDYHKVYVRTAVSVDPSGWAHFEYVKLPEYRWGIFLADPVHDRRIGFGDFFGQPVWHEVPGEFRNQLRRLIVTQGDTEPASVEQQRWLGHRCPSHRCCSTEAGSVSPCVTMRRRSWLRNSPGTSCHTGWPKKSPKPIRRSCTGSARKMPQRYSGSLTYSKCAHPEGSTLTAVRT